MYKEWSWFIKRQNISKHMVQIVVHIIIYEVWFENNNIKYLLIVYESIRAGKYQQNIHTSKIDVRWIINS